MIISQIEKIEGKLIRTSGWRDPRTEITAAHRALSQLTVPEAQGIRDCRKANAETLAALERESKEQP